MTDSERNPSGHRIRLRPRLRSPRHWPVRWRITGISAGLTLLILLVFALVVGRLATDRMRSDFRNELQQTANQLAFEIPARTAGTAETLRNAMLGDGAIKVVYANGNDAIPNPPGSPNLGPPVLDQVVDVGPYEVASQASFTNQFGVQAYVEYARPHEAIDSTVGRLWLLLGLGVLGGTVLAGLAGLAVAGRAMRPISSLTATAREIATTRDPSRRVPMPESQDEVAELALTLDQMLRELDAARGETAQMMQSQRDFVADASHELRTPLTSILANLELLEASFAERDADPDEEEIVAGALGSSRRMRRLVADLLLLAQADAGRSGPRRDCSLRAIAEAAVSEARPVAEGHRLVLRGDAPALVHGSRDDLHRLVLNLVENGIRHTPAQTTITVAVSETGDEVELDVSDDGPGIPADVGGQIFSRFVRGDGPADLATNGGTGLGLAIVQAVATSHGGTVTLGRSRAGGARFTVRLPLASREAAARPAEVS